MHGEYKMPGGKLIVADIEIEDERLSRVQISGDFFLQPDSALDTIDRALAGLPAASDQAAMTAAIELALGEEVAMYGISADAIAVAVARARDDRS